MGNTCRKPCFLSFKYRKFMEVPCCPWQICELMKCWQNYIIYHHILWQRVGDVSWGTYIAESHIILTNLKCRNQEIWHDQISSGWIGNPWQPQPYFLHSKDWCLTERNGKPKKAVSNPWVSGISCLRNSQTDVSEWGPEATSTYRKHNENSLQLYRDNETHSDEEQTNYNFICIHIEVNWWSCSFCQKH